MSDRREKPVKSEEPSLSNCCQIRRAKLKELQDAGQDPFHHHQAMT